MSADISIMNQCACGSGPRNPNYECERCRLVYFVRLVGRMREAQINFFRGDKTVINEAKRLEGQVDDLVKRFTAQPESTLFPDDGDAENYYQVGG